MAVVEFSKVDIVFGRSLKPALALVDQGATRDEILATTGCVLGAAGIDLAIERGEICVLMGLSGSGKSTILRAINRLNKVSRGAVTVEHKGKPIDVVRCDETMLREIRMHTVSTVFQQFALLPWRTVRENVGFGLELQGMKTAERNRIVDEKLAMVGLSKWADKHAHELSGGMQQRVGLARAFATDADILLMDEPFSALDPLIRNKLQDELLELQDRLKKTIVFVSHDLDEAMKLGDKIVILEGGRIVQSGTAEDILLRPADAYVAEFVQHMNPLNVLRGSAVMRPMATLVRDAGVIVFGADIRLELDPAGKPQRASCAGAELRFVPCTLNGEAGLTGTGEILIAPVEMALRDAMALKLRSAHPLLLVDGEGRLAGLCGDEEIYASMLRRPAV
jgi:glycine betaine/proline transport system ATP-binding protein